MTGFSAKIILDSMSPEGKRITTISAVYPRFVHSELMTHRQFSRNAMSSRAVPIKKMIEQVRTNPAAPIHWGSNRPGMSAGDELIGLDLEKAKDYWFSVASTAANYAEAMANLGLHKQIVNRVLEPFQWMHTIITSTEWDNFFDLRLALLEDGKTPVADPNMHELAKHMSDAIDASTPVVRERHLPYVSEEEITQIGSVLNACSISAARCARVSYLNHDGSFPNIEKDLDLAHNLQNSRHASPFEHIAFAAERESRSRNFMGWTQFRAVLDL